MRGTRHRTIVIAVALLVAVVTWVIGWWAVVLVGAVAGWCLRDVAAIAVWTGAGAVLGWALLLALDAAGGRLGALSRVLSGTLSLPTAALVVLTLAIPALLGWSAATLGAEAGNRLGRRRRLATYESAPAA